MPRTGGTSHYKNRGTLPLVARTTMTIVLIVVSCGMLILTATASAAQDEGQNIEWHTGRELDRFNEFSISAWWTDAPLRNRLIAFSRQQKVAIFIDRRVDPSTHINIGLKAVTPEQFLWAVGEKFNLGVCRIDDFYYVGPTKSAAALPLAIRELTEQTTVGHRSFKVNWSAIKPLKTTNVVQPKFLLEQLATDNGFSIKNLDALPHDLWADFELPPTRVDTQVAILLIGFGKWFVRSKDGTQIELIDFPILKSGELVFSDIKASKKTAERYSSEFPELTIKARGKRLVAAGAPVNLAALKSALVKAQIAETGVAELKTFTLTTRASRGVILASIAQQTDNQLEFDRSSESIQKALQEHVDISVKEASFGELMVETLNGSSLKYEMADGILKIEAR